VFIIKNPKLAKYFFIFAFIVVIYLSFLIVKPFIRPILGSIIVAYLFYPVYKWVYKKLKRKKLSALLVTICIILILIIPFAFTMNKLIKEATLTYVTINQMVARGSIINIDCDETKGALCALSLRIKNIVTKPRFRYYVDQSLNKIISFITDSASEILISLPRRFIDLFIVFFIVFYLFKDGKEIVSRFGELLPIKKHYKAHILQEFKEVMWGVMYGNVLVALIQGAVGGFGFFIFGLILNKFGGIYSPALLGSPIVWGLIMALFAMVPLGTPVVWLPIALVQLLKGLFENNLWLVGTGIGLLIYGTFVISTIDNIIKPYVIGARSKVHPGLVILGIFGGLIVFGFVGLFVGPIVLGMLATFIRIYEKERHQLLDL